jgi:hypothetical protein
VDCNTYRREALLSATRIGVLGGGKQTRKNAVALLKDFIGDRQVEIYVVGDPFDDASRFAADYALMAGVPTSIFTAEDSTENFDDYEGATFFTRENPVEALTTVLARGQESVLLYCFAETDGEEEVLKGFLTAGVQVLDYADGLYPVTLEDDGTETPEVVETVEVTEANVAVLADDDLGLEPETTTEPAAVEDDGFAPEPEVEVIADEAQQPEQAPAKKPRARKGSPLKVVDEQVAESAVSDETTELIELGRAIKTLLDYVAKASNTGKTVNVQVV